LSYQENFKAIYLIGTVIASLIFYFFIAVLIKAFKRTDINLNY
jgi:putative peptidoglycan lipid II flippase